MPAGTDRRGHGVPRRKRQDLIDGIPAVFASKDDPTWASVAATTAWCASEGVPLGEVALLSIDAGPATRYDAAVAAWRQAHNHTGHWPYRVAGSARERLKKILERK